MGKILENIIEIKEKIEKLPPLSPVEKVKLENSIEIDQLYNSSKLEGSQLTDEMINRAIYGQSFSASEK